MNWGPGVNLLSTRPQKHWNTLHFMVKRDYDQNLTKTRYFKDNVVVGTSY